MIISLIIFLAAVYYFTITISTGDFFWFLKGFWEKPIEVVVYHDGQKNRYLPGNQGFDELAEGVRASLSEGFSNPSTIGLSPESLDDAYNKYFSVEAFFPYPVKVHAWFNTNAPTQMLFLVKGRHAEMPLVLLGGNGKYLSGAPVLKTREPLLQALQKLGYVINP